MATGKYISAGCAAAAIFHLLVARVTSSLCPLGNFGRTEGPKFVTVVPGGRLGNAIFEYLSVWAYAQETGAVPAVPSEILLRLSDAFVDLKINSLEDVAANCNAGFLNEILENRERYVGNRTSRFTVLPRVTVFRKFAVDWMTLIENWSALHRNLRFRPELVEQSRRTLAQISLGANGTEFVAVHVHRTDYPHHIHSYTNATLANATFFLAAMDLMRKTLHSPPVFVVTSDDPSLCTDNLNEAPDTVVVRGGSPESDLALLASCNHTIFAYGTFGMAAAMFNAGGQTVVYDTGSTDYYITYHFARQLANWTTLTN